MAWTIRSLADISARTRGAFRQYMKGTDAALNTNFVTVVAKVLAGISHEFELRMAWLTKQLFLSTATGRFLALHASDIGIFRKGASGASGTISVSAAANVTYAAGIRFVSGGITYVSTAPATASPLGVLVLQVQAEPTGANTNRDADGILTLADPVLWPSIGEEATVGASGLGGGADVEDDDNLRARALHRKRNPRSGGRLTDYETVALSVPGVFKVWAFRRPLAPGYLALFFLFEGRPNSIPTAGDVVVVQAAIDAERLIRIDDSVAIAPTPLPIDVEIHRLANDTTEVREAINESLAAMYLERCRPGIEGDTFTLSRSWIGEAISQATGEDRHVLAWPLDDIVLTNGQFPVPGVVTYGA